MAALFCLAQIMDFFNTRFRIDVKNRLRLQKEQGEGYITLSDVTGDWPFIGNDIQNTHATDSLGPKESNRWWQKQITKKYADHKVLTPVIRDGKIIDEVTNRFGFRARSKSRRPCSKGIT